MKQRAEADSIRLASGDTTEVEYPVADPAMFSPRRSATAYPTRWVTTSVMP